MARSRSSGKKKTLSVNFKGVEGRVTVAEGEYLVKVAEVTAETGDKADYLKWKFEIAEGKFAGKFVFTNTSLSPQALWNLRGLLEAMGVETTDNEMDLDLVDYVDRELMVVVEHELYDGKKQARVVDYAAIDEDEVEEKKPSKKRADDNEDDEDAKPARKKRATADEDEDEDEDEKPTRKPRRAADDEDEDDKPTRKSRRRDDVEDDEKPARGKKKKAAAISADDIQDMSQDELEDLITESDLDIDLGKIRTLSKMRNTVLDAMVEAELVEA